MFRKLFQYKISRGIRSQVGCTTIDGRTEIFYFKLLHVGCAREYKYLRKNSFIIFKGVFSQCLPYHVNNNFANGNSALQSTMVVTRSTCCKIKLHFVPRMGFDFAKCPKLWPEFLGFTKCPTISYIVFIINSGQFRIRINPQLRPTLFTGLINQVYLHELQSSNC